MNHRKTILTRQAEILIEHIDENFKSGVGVVNELYSNLHDAQILINDLSNQIENLQLSINEIRGHARAALVQSLPSDDQIIMQHFREIVMLCK